MSAIDPLDALRAGVADVSKQAGGLVSIRVVMMAELPALAADALLGHGQAVQIMNAVLDTVRRFAAAPRRLQPICATCPKPLRPRRFNLAFVTPECGGPTRMLALGVCRHCATDAAGVMAKATESLRRLWPDLRTIKPTHTAAGSVQ